MLSVRSWRAGTQHEGGEHRLSKRVGFVEREGNGRRRGPGMASAESRKRLGSEDNPGLESERVALFG